MVASWWRSAAGKPCTGHRSRRLMRCARRPTCGCNRRSSRRLGRVRSWRLAPGAAAGYSSGSSSTCAHVAVAMLLWPGTHAVLCVGHMKVVCPPCCICSRCTRLMHAGHGQLVMVQRPARRQQQMVYRVLCDTRSSLQIAACACKLYQRASDTTPPPYADVGSDTDKCTTHNSPCFQGSAFQAGQTRQHSRLVLVPAIGDCFAEDGLHLTMLRFHPTPWRAQCYIQ